MDVKQAFEWSERIADAMTAAGIVKLSECCGVITVLANNPQERPVGCSLNYDDELKRWTVDLDAITAMPADGEDQPS